MSNSWDDRRKAQEEEYFRRKEQESLDKLRAQLDDDKASAEAAAKRDCPRCDGTLQETQVEGVTIERCDKCGGVWLDAGELETLTTHEQHGSFFGRLFGK